MPFQTAPRRASCITCRKPIERGDRCYLGARTGMTWCESCAPAVAPVAEPHTVEPMSAVQAGLKALAEKHQWPVPRSWHETED